MTHVVTSACVDHKYQDCVSVCPVEAFREADNYLVIDPDEFESWLDRNEEEAPDLPIAEGDSPVLA